MARESYLNQDIGGRRERESEEQSFDSSIADLSAVDKRYAKLIGSYDNYQKMMSLISKKYGVERLEEELKNSNLSVAERQAKEAELEQLRVRVRKQSIDATLAYEENAYKRASIAEKAEIQQRRAEAIKSKIEELKETSQLELAAAQGDAKRQQEINEQLRAQTLGLLEEQQKASDAYYNIQKSAVSAHFDKVKEKFSKLKEDKSLNSAVSLAVELKNFDAKSLKNIAADQKKAAEAAKQSLKTAEEKKNELLAQGYSEDSKEVKEAEAEISKRKNEHAAAKMGQIIGELVADTVGDKFDAAFKEAEDILTQYKGKIDARLQGSDTSYNRAAGLISTNLSLSPFVKTQDVIKKLQEASDKGIAYNLELRTFLSSISDKIAGTFDAFDSNLTRLIRLQQADTTAARLGMEARLTKFLNGMFQDNSYLSTVADAVSSAIIDANSTLSRNASAEFEYIVQKWLGSLSSLGMSEGTITEIAKGINYLATGDVTNLSNSTQLQTLFAMSASRAGLEYSDLLLRGLNASNTNKLLQSMVTYLKEIAENSDNQVVRAAYGDIFNMTMSDMKAISNLTTKDISNIASNSLSYGGMMGELGLQFVQLISRTSMSEMMANLYNNAVFGVAEDFVSNPAIYGMYKMLNFMEDQDFDIDIPFVNVMGFGLDVNASVREILEMGVGISAAFSLLGNILGGLGSVGGLNLNSWGGSDYTQRGSGMSFSTAGISGGTSGSTYVASGNSGDYENSALNEGKDHSEKTREITNENLEEPYTISDIYESVILGTEGNNWLRVEEKLLSSVYTDTGSRFLHTQDSRMKFDGQSLKVALEQNKPLDVFVTNSPLSVQDTAVIEALGTLSTVLVTTVGGMKSKIEGLQTGLDAAQSDLRAAQGAMAEMEGQFKDYQEAVAGAVDNLYNEDGSHNVEGYVTLNSLANAGRSTTSVDPQNSGMDTVASITSGYSKQLEVEQSTRSMQFNSSVSQKGSSSSTPTSTKSDPVGEDSIGTLVKMLQDGTAKVKVSNVDGGSLSIDTDMSSTLYHAMHDNS